MSSLKSPEDLSNRPNRVKKIKSYEEEDTDQPLPSKKKKKLSHAKHQQTDVTTKPKKISFVEAKAVKLEEGSQTAIKRPRGRPPLASGNKSKPSTATSTKTVVSSPHIPTVSAATVSTSKSSAIAPPLYVQQQTKHVIPPFQLLQLPPPVVETVKAARPSSTQVTNSVLKKLMVSDPLSTVELMKFVPDAPRDLVQSVLDVLQVLGLVVAFKVKEAMVADSPLVPAGTSVSTNLYSLTGQARAQSAVELSAVAEDMAAQVEKQRSTRLRMKELHELVSREGMTSAERLAALRALIDTFLAREPHLWDDPLYRAVIEQTGNVFHAGGGGSSSHSSKKRRVG